MEMSRNSDKETQHLMLGREFPGERGDPYHLVTPLDPRMDRFERYLVTDQENTFSRS